MERRRRAPPPPPPGTWPLAPAGGRARDMVRAANIGTEEVEKAVAAIALHLDSSRWQAVDLLGGGERLRHTHPPGCPKKFKAKFQGNHAVQLQVRGVTILMWEVREVLVGVCTSCGGQPEF